MRNPLNIKQVQLFFYGKFSHGIIQSIYKKSRKIKKYFLIVGPQKQEAAQSSLKELKTSLEQIQKNFTQNMKQRIDFARLYIEKYGQKKQNQKNHFSQMIAQIQQKEKMIKSNQELRNKYFSKQIKLQNSQNHLKTRKTRKTRNLSAGNQQKSIIQQLKKPQLSMGQSSKDQFLSQEKDYSDDSLEGKSFKSNKDQIKIEEMDFKKREENKQKTPPDSKIIQGKTCASIIRDYDRPRVRTQLAKSSGFIYSKQKEQKWIGTERVHRMEFSRFKRLYTIAFNNQIDKRQTEKVSES